MITIKFDTFNHTLDFEYDGIERTYNNVTTIKVHEGYYEVLQRQSSTDKNAPLMRLPITKTIIEYIHE